MEKVYPHGDRSWWLHDRFGMFIHWGIYSVPARGEWVHTRGEIMPEDYQRYAEFFTPDKFDPVAWAKAARYAGMKYMVFTAKHHDGYCMWNTAYTDYKADRDYVKEIVEAFRAEGIRTGLYYSLLDWHHKDFLVDRYHPLRRQDREELNSNRDMKRYCQYMRDQVRELLTNYGKIDIMWFDFTYPVPDGKCAEDWEAEKLLAMIRELAPDILIDDRMGLPGSGDFVSPEQYVPHNGMRDKDGNMLYWEGCQTFSGAWGYNRDESSWKTPHQLINMLVSHVGKGGNLLLNVGPDARGRFDKRAMNALNAIGEWMELNSDSIYGCTLPPAEFPVPEDCRYTYNPATKKLYLHLLAYPVKFVFLPNLKDKVKFARFLNDHSEIPMKAANAEHSNITPKLEQNILMLQIPAIAPDTLVPVIELTLK